jgi:hypothetical protein
MIRYNNIGLVQFHSLQRQFLIAGRMDTNHKIKSSRTSTSTAYINSHGNHSFIFLLVIDRQFMEFSV